MNRDSHHWSFRSSHPSAEEPLREWLSTIYGPVRKMGNAWLSAVDAAVPSYWALNPSRGPGCECSRCQARHRCDACDACACNICDADLSVVAYPGETRIVPVELKNERKHDRKITMTLSSWTTSTGETIAVESKIAPSEFTLLACQEHVVAVELVVPAGKHGDRGARPATHCVVAYADLTIQGCDVRPLRLAVAILPLGCDAHTVNCGCGCC